MQAIANFNCKELGILKPKAKTHGNSPNPLGAGPELDIGETQFSFSCETFFSPMIPRPLAQPLTIIHGKRKEVQRGENNKRKQHCLSECIAMSYAK